MSQNRFQEPKTFGPGPGEYIGQTDVAFKDLKTVTTPGFATPSKCRSTSKLTMLSNKLSEIRHRRMGNTCRVLDLDESSESLPPNLHSAVDLCDDVITAMDGTLGDFRELMATFIPTTPASKDVLREFRECLNVVSSQWEADRKKLVTEQNRVRALEPKIAKEAADEIHRLNESMKQVETRCATLESELAAVESAHAETLKNLETVEAEAENYAELMESTLEETESELKDAVRQLGAADVELMESRDIMAQHQNSMAYHIHSVDEIHAQEVGELQNRLAAANQEASRLQEKRDVLAAEKESLSIQLQIVKESARVTEEMLRTEVEQLKAAVSMDHDMQDALCEEIDALNNLLSAARIDKMVYQRDMDAAVKMLQLAIDEKNHTYALAIAELKDTNAILENKKTEHDIFVRDTESRMFELRSTMEALQQYSDAVCVRKTVAENYHVTAAMDLADAMDTLEEREQQWYAQLTHAEAIGDNYAEQVDELLEYKASLEAELEAVKIDLDRIECENAMREMEMMGEIKDVEVQLQQTRDILEDERIDFHSRELYLMEQIIQANVREVEKNLELAETHKQFADIKAERDVAKRTVDDLSIAMEVERDSMSSQIAKYQAGLAHFASVDQRHRAQGRAVMDMLKASVSVILGIGNRCCNVEEQLAVLALKLEESETPIKSQLREAINAVQAAKDDILTTQDSASQAELLALQVEQMTAERERWLVEMLEWKSREAAANERHVEIAAENLRLKTEAESMKEQMERLAAENNRLVSMVCAQIDHNNTAQKIHMHRLIKQENNRLKEEISSLSQKLVVATRALAQYGCADLNTLCQVEKVKAVAAKELVQQDSSKGPQPAKFVSKKSVVVAPIDENSVSKVRPAPLSTRRPLQPMM